MGIRVGPSELFDLKWTDIDIKNSVIHLRAAKKNRIEPIRDIPIRKTLIKELQSWRDADKMSGIEHVIHFKGRPIRTIHVGWRAALKRAGINRKIRPYDLRHAFATEAIAAGADIGTVAKLMGHTSLTMVLKHYQHVLDSQKLAAVEAIPNLSMWQKICGNLPQTALSANNTLLINIFSAYCFWNNSPRQGNHSPAPPDGGWGMFSIFPCVKKKDARQCLASFFK